MTDVFLSEEELSVQIANLNVVIVGAVNSSLWCTTYTHKCESLHKLTAKSTCSYQKGLDLAKFFLNCASEDLYLIIVPAVIRGAIYFALRNRLKNVVV